MNVNMQIEGFGGLQIDVNILSVQHQHYSLKNS